MAAKMPPFMMKKSTKKKKGVKVGSAKNPMFGKMADMPMPKDRSDKETPAEAKNKKKETAEGE